MRKRKDCLTYEMLVDMIRSVKPYPPATTFLFSEEEHKTMLALFKATENEFMNKRFLERQ